MSSTYSIRLNGEEIFRGTAYACGQRFHVSDNTIRSAQSKQKGIIKGKYQVVNLGVIDKRFNPNLDYFLRHLREYGNTVSKADPHKYIADIEKEMGEKIAVTKRYDRKDDSMVEKKQRGRKECYYILEVL